MWMFESSEAILGLNYKINFPIGGTRGLKENRGCMVLLGHKAIRERFCDKRYANKYCNETQIH